MTIYQELLKWLSVVELPVFAALFKIVYAHRDALEQKVSRTRELLGEYKLLVANNYVSNAYLKDVESRLTNHLIRIEKKLDSVGRI